MYPVQKILATMRVSLPKRSDELLQITQQKSPVLVVEAEAMCRLGQT
jgi:hypothetical protein